MPEFCHICRAGGKECVNITDQRDLALFKYHIKCSVCGRPLVEG